MKTTEIVDRINSEFGTIYRSAQPFVNSGDLWNFCIDVISNPTYMSCITFANDLEIPPVKSLALIYKRVINPKPGFEFKDQEKKDMGALMGFVFKYVLGYTDQKERCTVNDLGIKTATRFMNAPVTYFE